MVWLQSFIVISNKLFQNNAKILWVSLSRSLADKKCTRTLHSDTHQSNIPELFNSAVRTQLRPRVQTCRLWCGGHKGPQTQSAGRKCQNLLYFRILIVLYIMETAWLQPFTVIANQWSHFNVKILWVYLSRGLGEKKIMDFCVWVYVCMCVCVCVFVTKNALLLLPC